MDLVAKHKEMRLNGCTLCHLGTQSDLIGPVVYRGDINSKWVIVAEAPGKLEDKQGLPMVGPSGKLLDSLINEYGLPQPLITNTCYCRPIAPKGSGKENTKPSKECINICSTNHLYPLIHSVNPKVIVLMGMSAVSSLLPELAKQQMKDIVGCSFASPHGGYCSVMYHPAFLLRQQHIPTKKDYYKEVVSNYFNKLKTLLEEK
jgi:DNA polymerase